MGNDYNFTKEILVRDLRELGLESGDTVVMHSNAGSLGPARQMVKAPDTGMRWMLDALLEVLGPAGTLAVPTLTSCWKDHESGQVWNPDTTPSRVGSLTNYVLTQPGRARSDHPTHSLAALGGRTKEFCAGHSWRDGVTTFDRNGPWGHLVDWNGKILWLGTDMRTQTAVHAVEDWMRLPYMGRTIAVVDDNGTTREVEMTMCPSGPRDFYRADSKCALAWDAAGLGQKGKVCRADSQLMGAREFFDWLWNALLADPALLLKDDPEDEWTVKARKDTAEYLATFEGTWKR